MTMMKGNLNVQNAATTPLPAIPRAFKTCPALARAIWEEIGMWPLYWPPPSEYGFMEPYFTRAVKTGDGFVPGYFRRKAA